MERNKHTTDLNRIVFEAIGEASMCWTETPRGVFDSQKAEDVALRLIKAIKDDLEIDTKNYPRQSFIRGYNLSVLKFEYMRDLQKRIREKIQELADGRVHQYEDVEAVFLWLEFAIRQDERENIIENIIKL